MKNLISISILLLIPFLFYGQRTNLSEEILCSPVLLKTNIGQGSGIFIKDSTYIYFVTARHNLFSIDTVNKKNKIDTVFKLLPDIGLCYFFPHNVITDKPAMIEIDLKKAQKSNLIKFHKSQDIAIIAIGFFSKKVKDSIEFINYFNFVKKDRSTYIHASPYFYRKYSEVYVGNEIYLFGFPGSIGLIESPQFDYDRPLLRKGIVSGKFEKKKTIIIDCPSYYGNSGGPVWEIFVEKNIEYMSVIGILTEFIPYVDEWKNLKNNIVNLQTSNSNYSIVTPIEFAVELIKEFK